MNEQPGADFLQSPSRNLNQKCHNNSKTKKGLQRNKKWSFCFNFLSSLGRFETTTCYVVLANLFVSYTVVLRLLCSLVLLCDICVSSKFVQFMITRMVDAYLSICFNVCEKIPGNCIFNSNFVLSVQLFSFSFRTNVNKRDVSVETVRLYKRGTDPQKKTDCRIAP